MLVHKEQFPIFSYIQVQWHSAVKPPWTLSDLNYNRSRAPPRDKTYTRTNIQKITYKDGEQKLGKKYTFRTVYVQRYFMSQYIMCHVIFEWVKQKYKIESDTRQIKLIFVYQLFEYLQKCVYLNNFSFNFLKTVGFLCNFWPLNLTVAVVHLVVYD